MSDDSMKRLTGSLMFRNVEFTFVFADDELTLIPPKEKQREVKWGVELSEDYGSNELDREWIVGTCNENEKRIVFIPETGSRIVKDNSVLILYLTAYILFDYAPESKICGMGFYCPELNYIFPVSRAFKDFFCCNTIEDANKGIYNVSTLPFSDTTTKEESFQIDGIEVKACFGYSYTCSISNNRIPISAQTELRFSFDATEDYIFVVMLWRIARAFIRFLCYRKDIHVSPVKLYTLGTDGVSEFFATLYPIEDHQCSDDNDEKILNRCIKQAQIAGSIGGILTSIADNSLYITHLPRTYEEGRHLTAANFVLTGAAFDWEFKKLFPGGVSKSQEQINGENAVKTAIDGEIAKSTDEEVRTIWERLKGDVSRVPLQKSVCYTLESLSDVVEVFGRRLCYLNNEKYDTEEISKAFIRQRNNFAHGSLRRKFEGYSLTAVIFMQYVVYAIQLKRFDISDNSIQKAICDLFGLSLCL